MAKRFAHRLCVSCSDPTVESTAEFDDTINSTSPGGEVENMQGCYIMGRQSKDGKVFPLMIPKAGKDIAYNATSVLSVKVEIDDSLKSQKGKLGSYEGDMEFDVSFDLADQNSGDSDTMVVLAHYDNAMTLKNTRTILKYPRRDGDVVDKSAVWVTVVHKKVIVKGFKSGDTVAVVLCTRNKPGFSAAIDDVVLQYKWKGFK